MKVDKKKIHFKKIDQIKKETDDNVKKKKKRNKKRRKTGQLGKNELHKKMMLDKEGDVKPARASKSGKGTPAHRVLGYDALLEKERDLVADLFGDIGDGGDAKDEEKPQSDEEEEEEKVVAAVKVEEGQLPPLIPHDPFDIHQEDEQEHRRPAWIDDDDRTIRVKDVVASMDRVRGSRGVREESEEQYSRTLQQKFNQTLVATPEWARLPHPDTEEEHDAEGEDLVKSTGDYLVHGRSAKLDKGWIHIKRQCDLNYASRTEGSVISAVEFHPNHQVALVSGFSSTVVGAVSLFKVDGTHNHLIQSVKFPKYPALCAKFMCGGSKFVVGSNVANYFYMYDLEAAKESKIPTYLGRDGHNIRNVLVSPDEELLVFVVKSGGQMHLFDANCLSHVGTLYASGNVTDATFNDTGSRLYAHTEDGNVCIFDMNARSCIHRFYDDGCIAGTSIAVSPSGQYLACGSSSGVVNVYDVANVMNPSPRPLKMLERLRTSVTSLQFNASSEILASASDRVDNAIKLTHLPSMTYFYNYPTPKSDLRRVHVVNFSPQSGYLATGNRSGRAYLYRLHHFTSY